MKPQEPISLEENILSQIYVSLSKNPANITSFGPKPAAKSICCMELVWSLCGWRSKHRRAVLDEKSKSPRWCRHNKSHNEWLCKSWRSISGKFSRLLEHKIFQSRFGAFLRYQSESWTSGVRTLYVRRHFEVIGHWKSAQSIARFE